MHYHDQRKALIKKKISAWNKEKRINTLGPGIARWWQGGQWVPKNQDSKQTKKKSRKHKLVSFLKGKSEAII